MDDVLLTRAEATWAYWQIAPQYDESGPPPDTRFFTVMHKLRPSEAEVAAVYAAKAVDRGIRSHWMPLSLADLLTPAQARCVTRYGIDVHFGL